MKVKLQIYITLLGFAKGEMVNIYYIEFSLLFNFKIFAKLIVIWNELIESVSLLVRMTSCFISALSVNSLVNILCLFCGFYEYFV